MEQLIGNEINETGVLDFKGIGLIRKGNKVIMDKVITAILPWDNFTELPKFYKDYESISELRKLRR